MSPEQPKVRILRQAVYIELAVSTVSIQGIECIK